MTISGSAISLFNYKKTESGFQVLLVDACSQSHLVQKNNIANLQTNTVNDKRTVTLNREVSSFPAKPKHELTDMHHQLINICLRNPNLNDFHLHDKLRKLIPTMTMDTLCRLKQECGFTNREVICNILLNRLFLSCNSELNATQLKFIYKMHPELHDRAVRPNRPGELIVYKCLFGKRLEKKGSLYVHVFIDMFNGWSFARINSDRSLKEGIRILQKHIEPIYKKNGFHIIRVLQTLPDNRNKQNITRLLADQNAITSKTQWEICTRQFGLIKHFQRQLITSNFFENYREELSSFRMLAAFSDLIKRYNAEFNFHQQRPILRSTTITPCSFTAYR